MMKKIFLLIALVSFASNALTAEVFQWTDSQGKRHYSDRPHREAKTLKIHPGYHYQKVRKVYDGDTVLLMNGQKVRFLGVNTPEVEGRNKPAEPGGEAAKKWLSEKLNNKKVRLESDAEKKDKYGRVLAHVFTEEGTHLNLELVKFGLATVNIHPPNLKYTNELLLMQEQAENTRRGIWGNQHYAALPYAQLLGSDSKGWKRATGVIKKIKQTRKNIYLQFADNFSIKIARQYKHLFPVFERYLGKNIEVRGWLHKSKNRYTMLVRHPGSIKF